MHGASSIPRIYVHSVFYVCEGEGTSALKSSMAAPQ